MIDVGLRRMVFGANKEALPSILEGFVSAGVKGKG